ncbi:MAG: acyl-CoA dehydrogenase, partial [Solirubrobacteraceae bacterium]|nr:acyl-CoA dehydrogenase [Solirubrobacteraceae bacterium]
MLACSQGNGRAAPQAGATAPATAVRTLLRMAWDFSTEPAFQADLDWMATFVREEIWPLETLDLDRHALDRALRPLQERVR